MGWRAASGLRPPHRTMSTTGGSLYREAFPQVFTEGVTPTPLQELLATIDLPAPGSRLVVESETGSSRSIFDFDRSSEQDPDGYWTTDNLIAMAYLVQRF